MHRAETIRKDRDLRNRLPIDWQDFSHFVEISPISQEFIPQKRVHLSQRTLVSKSYKTYGLSGPTQRNLYSFAETQIELLILVRKEDRISYHHTPNDFRKQ